MNSRWMIALAVAGVVASAACGVDDEVTGAKAPANLEQARQALFVDIYSDVGSPVTSGSVYGAANEFTAPASCADGPGGSDLSFKWTAPQTGSYTFNTAGAGSLLDSVLHIYTFNTTTATQLLGCNDNIDLAANNLASSVTLTLTAGTQIRIIVDSYEPPTSRNGAFKLNIIANFELCPNAMNDCKVSPGTWTQTGCYYAPKAAGTTCSDGNSCTTGDVCDGAGTCGGQQMSCPNTANVTAASCSSGSCGITTCSAGWTNCDGNYSNGCETDLNSSNTNCGACGNVCGSTQACVNGTCEAACDFCAGVQCCAPRVCTFKPNSDTELCK
jgi:hypothetical protein